jgi:hypothetical protein
MSTEPVVPPASTTVNVLLGLVVPIPTRPEESMTTSGFPLVSAV